MPTSPSKKKAVVKKKGGWSQKIPKDVLLSPGGVILVLFAIAMEMIDLFIPWPIVEEAVMLPLNILFCFLLVIVAKVSIKSIVIPFLIERLPIISTLLPTFLLRLFF